MLLRCLLLCLLCGTATAANECHDKIDNDGDGLIDRADPDCWRGGKAEITPLQPVYLEYTLEHQQVAGLDLRVRGVGYDGGGVLVLIAPLNHTRCADGTNTADYDCPAGEVPLAEGMLYLAHALAQKGATAIVVDMNQLTWWAGGPHGFSELIELRAHLLLAHAALWPHDELYLVGHSLGGGAAAVAAELLEADALYLIAPAGVQDVPTMRFGLLLGACDEDPGTHSLPGMHVFDRAIDVRTHEIEQAYLTAANHKAFNSEAWNQHLSGCDVPPMDSVAQRDAAAQIVTAFLFDGPRYAGARYSSFDSSPNPTSLDLAGFTEILACTAQACERPLTENRWFYYRHERPSIALTWDGQATISGHASLRATLSIAETEGPVLFGDQVIPYPVTTYGDPCDETFCYSWWMEVPREILHTVVVDGTITLSGRGRMILADIEEL